MQPVVMVSSCIHALPPFSSFIVVSSGLDIAIDINQPVDWRQIQRPPLGSNPEVGV